MAARLANILKHFSLGQNFTLMGNILISLEARHLHWSFVITEPIPGFLKIYMRVSDEA